MPFFNRGAGRAIVAFAFAVFPMLSPAQTAGTVRIGNEVKNSTGLVKELQNGDISCVMVLQDDKGKEFIEAGDFPICFQTPSIIGKRVALKYRLDKVQSEECQGDPGCKKTRSIPLVVEARILDGKTAQASISVPAAAQATGQQSFCSGGEEIVFACRTGAKMVSVCAATNATRTQGYVQYRFGKPDARDALEMILPEDRLPAAKAASGDSVAFAGGGGAWLRFRKPPFSYVVYSGIGRWGPKGETLAKEGIVVERAGKAIANLKCSGKPVSLLGPDWFGKVGITANGEEFEFPE